MQPKPPKYRISTPLKNVSVWDELDFSCIILWRRSLKPDMVKAVVGEETQLKLAEDRLYKSSVPSQVGLVIGKLSSSLDRGLVFDLVPTPPNDNGKPACSLSESSNRDDKKKGLKGKSNAESSSLVIDGEWVAEHARQVSRMLLGGMNVVGIYIWATESSFKTSTLTLWQTVKGVAEAAPIFESDLNERLLLHISFSPRRWTCRNCMLDSSITSISLRPCDFKMGRVLASLQTFRCMYNFEIRLPIFGDYASKASTLRDVLQDGILCHAKELKGAKTIIDGNLVVEDQPFTAAEGLHEVELLLPFMKDSPAEACSQKEVVGVVVFSGSICSFAYLSPRVPILQAIADIKGDIIMSLQSRLDIISDEAEMDPNIDGDTEASSDISIEKSKPQLVLDLLRKPCNLSFPRRVLVPWLADTFICDYLQPSETFEVLKDHCKELMFIEAPADTSVILEPESEAISLTTKSFWDAVVNSYSASGSLCQSTTKMEKDLTQKGGKEESIKLATTFNIVTSIGMLLLAILVGLVFFFLDRKSLAH